MRNHPKLCLGVEAHLSARLQLYHAWVELLVSLLDIGGKNMLVVLDGSECDTISHSRNDAVSDKLLHPAGIAEVLSPLCEGVAYLLAKNGLRCLAEENAVTKINTFCETTKGRRKKLQKLFIGFAYFRENAYLCRRK